MGDGPAEPVCVCVWLTQDIRRPHSPAAAEQCGTGADARPGRTDLLSWPQPLPAVQQRLCRSVSTTRSARGPNEFDGDSARIVRKQAEIPLKRQNLRRIGSTPDTAFRLYWAASTGAGQNWLAGSGNQSMRPHSSRACASDPGRVSRRRPAGRGSRSGGRVPLWGRRHRRWREFRLHGDAPACA